MVELTHSTKSSTTEPIRPAQLFIGSPNQLIETVIHHLRLQLCPHGACGTCITCTQITQHQHHALLWITPEKNYTKEDIEPIMQVIAFSRDECDPFFIVIQNADLLNNACANSLLKPLEEPPMGYHFILTAQRLDNILPTIRSRCITISVQGANDSILHQELFNLFTQLDADPFEFQKTLDQSSINDNESINLLDAILNHWIAQYRISLEKKQVKKRDLALEKITLLKKAYRALPMPGSSILFWKNLYLQFTH